MVYSDYIRSLLHYKKQNLTTEQRTFLFKLLSGHDQSFKIKSYLKLRNSTLEGRDPTSLISSSLEDIGFLEITKGKFLSSSKTFRVTTFGLFHILLNITIYPPQFLIKYKEDIILKTIVYQFFEEKTIKTSTGRFYSQLTNYIQECCNFTMIAIEDIHSSSKEEDKIKITNRLKFDLEWLIRRLGFKLIIMYNDTNLLALNPELKDDVKVTIYELESKMKGILSSDGKFIELIKNLNKDFSDGYQEIMNIHQDNLEKQKR
ncbi:MAG: hypothetical protein ACE5SW_08230 [Nitrososphaeraceae archaeon]